MKNFNFKSVLFLSAIFGLSACSNANIETFAPLSPAAGVLREAAPNVWIEGPDSIQIGQEYAFTVCGETGTDAYYLQVEDTYFNDPSSFSVKAGVPAATQALITFHEYGHYKITATVLYSNPPKQCAYEVAKYYRPNLPYTVYDRSGYEAFDYEHPDSVPVHQWFTCYTGYYKPLNQYVGKIENYEHRIVVKARQRSFLNTFHKVYPGRVDHRWGPVTGEIIGTGAVGANTLTLPDAYRKLVDPVSEHPCDTYTILEPACENSCEFPDDHCGPL